MKCAKCCRVISSGRMTNTVVYHSTGYELKSHTVHVDTAGIVYHCAIFLCPPRDLVGRTANGNSGKVVFFLFSWRRRGHFFRPLCAHHCRVTEFFAVPALSRVAFRRSGQTDGATAESESCILTTHQRYWKISRPKSSQVLYTFEERKKIVFKFEIVCNLSRSVRHLTLADFPTPKKLVLYFRPVILSWTNYYL